MSDLPACSRFYRATMDDGGTIEIRREGQQMALYLEVEGPPVKLYLTRSEVVSMRDMFARFVQKECGDG